MLEYLVFPLQPLTEPEGICEIHSSSSRSAQAAHCIDNWLIATPSRQEGHLSHLLSMHVADLGFRIDFRRSFLFCLPSQNINFMNNKLGCLHMRGMQH